MNGYICFYKGKKIEVYADTSFHARIEACKTFKPKKDWQVEVVLAEKNGKPVVHTAIN